MLCEKDRVSLSMHQSFDSDIYSWNLYFICNLISYNYFHDRFLISSIIVQDTSHLLETLILIQTQNSANWEQQVIQGKG